MNKKDAANYLGISTRTLEWHVKQKNIGARKVRGKTGEIADFDEGELRKLKAQIEARREPSHAVVRDSPESPDSPDQSLARLSDVSPEQFAELLTRTYQAGAEAIMQRLPLMLPAANDGGRTPEPTISDLAHKLVLSLKEVSQLTGRSVARLREDCESGRLKAKKNEIARGWRVKRDDLDSYVRKL